MAEWLTTPAKFWAIKATGSTSPFINPQDDAVNSCLRLKRDSAHARILYRHNCLALEEVRMNYPRRSATEIAQSIHGKGYFCKWAYKDIVKATEGVIAAASRYKIIENELGKGSTCALGMEIPDSV